MRNQINSKNSWGLFCGLIMAVVISVALSACGKMPSEVDPYPGASPDNYDRTYPDPATDPAPKYSPRYTP